MKRLLVGSIFAPDQRNETWLRLQLHFLRKTVGDFDHVVFLNRAKPEMFTESTILGAVEPEKLWTQHELTDAMDALMRHFITQTNYEHYLMIDSDAFPVKEGWIDDLLELMEAKPEHGLVRRGFAAPVRCENLDSFPHGCAFFARGDWFREQSWERYSWEYMPATNFLGVPSKDVTLRHKEAILDANGGQLWFPLLRTNTVNLHPIMGAIYGHVFYHHGAGSRAPLFRAMMQGEYANVTDQEFTERRNVQMFDELRRHPEPFVDRLMRRQDVKKPFFRR